jgi:SAM-dependent methyltransferase
MDAGLKNVSAIDPEKPESYYAGCNQFLLRAVPASAQRILEVGCAEGHLGGKLKEIDPKRTVFGIERESSIADSARARLDEVFTLDIETDDPAIEPGSLDCILFGDILEHLVAPRELLTRYARFLEPHGIILCSIPNLQHHFLIAAILKGDFQYTAKGLLDATHLRFFTCSTICKLLLDAGFAPSIVDAIMVPCPKAFLAAAEPLLRHLGVDPGRGERHLNAYQYIVRGTPLGYAQPAEPEPPLSFVVCVSNEATLRANLLSSPCLGPGSPHELLLMRGCRSAAEGLNRGLARARHPLVICVHQDVCLPRGWPARLWQQYTLAREVHEGIGVLGVYGVSRRNGQVARAGAVVDRERLLKEGDRLPAAVDTLDELLLAVPKDASLAFDPQLGFHFYGADICLAARERGLASVAVDALCFHNSLHAGVPPDFFRSGQAFAAKWAQHLPVATSCALLNGNGQIHVG